jgi:glycosyltransferase involved in cell wall biosynthesis
VAWKKAVSLKKNILVISANLEVGGIERSLIGLLGIFDYSRYEVDLMLWRHEGPFFKFLPKGFRLLPQIPEYSTFQRPIIQILREGHVRIALARLRAKFSSQLDGKRKGIPEPGYLAIQRSWRLALPYLPMIPGQYDLAISFYGPHYTVTDRVNAKIKIGWIHTDYRMISTDGRYEEAMWDKLDYIAAVSNECRESFLERFPQFLRKTIVIENILSSEFVRQQAKEFDCDREMPPEAGLTRILSVGRFCHQKAFDEAILACRKLIDDNCNVRWYIIGYGPDESIIRQSIAANGLVDRFIILGMKTNPYPYMRACDLYVQPSRYEGKAVTVREAQILGKPVLITRFPTASSQVEEGVDGHICELGVDGIVAGVRRLIDDTTYRDSLAATSATRDYGNTEEVKKIYKLIEDGAV